MAEIVDLFTRLRRPLKRTAEEGRQPAGTYYARVSAWVGNNRGAFLMLRRAEDEIWTVPTVTVRTGETPFGAAKRAVAEQLGLGFAPTGTTPVAGVPTVDPANARHYSSERRDNLGVFRDVYLFRGSAHIEDVRVDPEQFSDVAWLMPADIEQAYKDGLLDSFLEYYFDLIYPE